MPQIDLLPSPKLLAIVDDVEYGTNDRCHFQRWARDRRAEHQAHNESSSRAVHDWPSR